MKEPIRIGVSSQNFRTITGHAGKSRRFIIFSGTGPDDLVESERLDLPKEESLHEFRGLDHPLFHLDMLITGSCGNGFRQRLSQHEVQIHTTSESDPLTAAQMVLKGEQLPPAEEHSHDHHHH